MNIVILEATSVQSDLSDSSDDLPLKTYNATSKRVPVSENIEPGNFVIVDYEGVKYPSVVVELKKIWCRSFYNVLKWYQLEVASEDLPNHLQQQGYCCCR
jgi:hypothetical protein